MGFRWVQKNISPIGIDIGADSIKLLQIAQDDPPQLISAAAMTIPPEVRAQPATLLEYLGGALKELLKQGRFKGKRAIVSISSAHAYVQHVRLAKCDAAMIESLLATELRGRLPLDPTQMVMRHVVVGEVFADGAARQEVICLAAARHYVLQIINLIRAAGLDVVGMHCEPMAILSAFDHLFDGASEANRTTLFVDIGASTSKVMIAHGKQMVFAKTIRVGGDHFNRIVAELTQISESDARKYRIQEAEDGVRPQFPSAPKGALTMVGSVAVIKPAEQPRVADATQLTQHLLDSEMLELLVDELQLCIGYHAAMFHDRPIEKVIFLGGESRQTAMCQRIAKALRLPAQLGDPLARLIRAPLTPAVNVDLHRSQPGWAVPMGLCLLPTNL
ncbi:MAG: hypothetical protein GC162_12175 [Planctomycetes bacterium]|nr:hypothetical protein [Planctomycetota bacterium]